MRRLSAHLNLGHLAVAGLLVLGACSSTASKSAGAGGAPDDGSGGRSDGLPSGGSSISTTGGAHGAAAGAGGTRADDGAGGNRNAGGSSAVAGASAGTSAGGASSGGASATGGAKASGTGGAHTGGANSAVSGGASSVGGASSAGGASSGGASGTAAGGSGVGGNGSTSAMGPCDIYAAGKTPCVAAFSTVRALSATFAGNLYQVKKSDGMTLDIAPLSPGGVANAAAQDAFCGTAKCTISIIYDQSGKGNHLTKAPGGSATYGPNDDVEAVADALPITINSHKAYGVHVVASASWTATGQVGYRNTHTNGIAKGDNPESEYMVTDGTYYNGACCFDFGNAEMQAVAGGYGTMEAIYFGNNNWWDKGAGSGPWVMADLEVGVYSMGGPDAYSDANKNGNKMNANSVSLAYPFVTAMLKGNSANATSGGPFTLKGGNAQSGKLTTMWDGAYPAGYSPMHRQGGVVLGVGGDNSSTARGNFYEGVMTTGYASTATDDAIQANIAAAGYGK